MVSGTLEERVERLESKIREVEERLAEQMRVAPNKPGSNVNRSSSQKLTLADILNDTSWCSPGRK